MNPSSFIDRLSDKVTAWVGSTASLVFHTVMFAFFFLSHWLFGWNFDGILLVLTTVVSLEAIYFSIFIQRSVIQQGVRLQEVEESIDDVEETLDDVEEALDDASEDIDDLPEDTAKEMEKQMSQVLAEMRSILDEFSKATKARK